MNELLIKLTNKINFKYAEKFDLDKERELMFAPVNFQGDSFFVAVCPSSNKALISEYVESLLHCRADFIYLSDQNFKDFFKEYETIIASKYPNKSNAARGTSEKVLSAESSKKFSLDSSVEEILNMSIDIGEIEPLEIDDSEKIVSIKPDASSVEQKPKLMEIPAINTIDEKPDAEPKVEYKEEIKGSEEELKKEAAKKDEKRVSKVKDPKTKKLGEILIESGHLTEKQIAIALAEAKALSIPLGSVLVKLGFITIKVLKEALGAQLGCELVAAEQLKSLSSAISTFPEDFVRMNKIIPLSMDEKSVVVGMVNPGDTKIINEIVYQTGLKPTVMMITHFEFENFVQTYYQGDEKDEADRLLKQIEDEDGEASGGDNLWEQVEKDIQDASGTVSKFANKIVTHAIDQRASDIHIEPRMDGYVVRYRIDGVLKEVFKIPAKIDSALISRFKVLARLNIAEHRRSQDGNFTIKYKKTQYDFRLNTLPVLGKEKMVIRVLASASSVKASTKDELKIVGAFPEDIERIRKLISAPNGIILTSGPTGSGKTTTLYSLIAAVNSEDVNITTIEDPVEIKLDGVNQSSVNPKAGITFATSLRAILRQDPDIILVGEIRDYETLEVAISASLTGHLVLSTIHTNSAAATITRLIEMGAKDYLISSTVAGVMAQRLVRKLCTDCKQEYKPSLEDAKKVLLDPGEIEQFMKTKIYKPVGCSSCDDTGYKGRVGVYEIMVINKEMKKLIAQRTHDVEIEEHAVRGGMKTLRQACLRHIQEGTTTIDEYVRTLGLITD